MVRVKKPDLIFLKYLLSCTEIECPGDLVYDSCATACPATCLNPEGSQDCQKPCIEACSCPEGLVREGDRCINASQCGCYLDRGLYLPVSPVQSKCLGIDLGENCLACAVVRNVGKESKDFGRNAGRLIFTPEMDGELSSKLEDGLVLGRLLNTMFRLHSEIALTDVICSTF